MSSGLRRFTGSSAPRRRQPEPATAEAAAGAAPGERCELCATPIPPEGTIDTYGHGHVVDLEHRSIRCTCRPCYLLFEHRGAAGGRYHAVPDRFLHDPEFDLTRLQWEELQIPVRMAFLFRNTEAGQWVAFYPSPAGPTESLLSLRSWDEVIAANPVFGEAAPDIEAVLVQRVDDAFEAFLVPITACYELVARVRMHWQGFDGGAEAHAEIARFFTSLRGRSELVTR